MKTTTALIIIIIVAALGYGLWHTRQQAAQTVPGATTTTATMDTTSSADNEWNMNAAGLGIKITKNGSGPAAMVGNTVSVDYTGTLEDGTVFDSSKGKAPISFTLGQGQVIPGWEQGILGMQVGEERQLNIPAELAYGDRGVAPVIPPGATLLFDVTLVAIK